VIRWDTLPRPLGLAAAALGVLAVAAGSPYASGHAHVDVAQLARVIEREDDHVTAIELARWIKERRAALRIVDVRSAAEFDDYHIPGAEHISLDSLAATPFHADETVVLYSEAGGHAAQAWVFLRAMGIARVFHLRGGLYEWLDQVMSPTLASDASPRERAAFDSAAVLSRYFGGVPQTGVTRSPDDALPVPRAQADSAATGRVAAGTGAAVRRIRRRGC
jgi:rhodanese-related sulfurtransferase